MCLAPVQTRKKLAIRPEPCDSFVSNASQFAMNQPWLLCPPAQSLSLYSTPCAEFQPEPSHCSTVRLTLRLSKDARGGNRMTKRQGQMVNLESSANMDQLRS